MLEFNVRSHRHFNQTFHGIHLISDTDSHLDAKGHAYRSTIIENFMRSL